MKKYFIIFILIAAFINLSAQEYPLVKTSRPRIYISQARFDYLQTHLNQGECGETYNRFISAVYSNWYNDPELYLLGEDSTQWTWTFTSKWAKMQGQMVPSIYKITNDELDLKRCSFLANKIINYYDTLDFENYSWYDNENIIRSFSDDAGILLDWCYNDFPDEIKNRFVQVYFKVNRFFMNEFIYSSAGNSYVSSHNAWNTIYANQNSLVLYNAKELSQEQKDTVEAWYRNTYDKWVNGFLPCYGYYRDEDGGWNWTAAYSMWSLVDQFQLFENMLISTGKNFYQDLDWVRNSINQYWHIIQPNGWTINWGDGFTERSADRVMHIHAREFNDPRSQWLAQEYSKSENIGWTWPLFQNLLYKDFEMEEIEKPNVPLDWWADKVGLSVSRTSWDEDASLVWFFNSPTKKAAHEHRDNNTFCVYKNSPQIINSGYYASYGDDHYKNYYTRTIAHNSVCVYDSEEVHKYQGSIVSNDGGQTESPTLMNYDDIFSPQFQKGNWYQFGAGANYSYSIGDAALSYDTNKVSKYIRKLLFVKPDLVFVLDYMILKDSKTKQRDAKFILHFQEEPEISGEVIKTEVPEHIITYNGKDVFQQNGLGNVAIRTLLPEDSKTTKIGGSGYEFYVNGENYPVSVEMDSINTTPGKWRMEVEPTVKSDTVIFVHSISIGDEETPAQPKGIIHRNNNKIAIEIDNDFYLFNLDTGRVSYEFPNIIGKREINIFACDLYHTGNVVYPKYKQVGSDTNGICQGSGYLDKDIDELEVWYGIIDKIEDTEMNDVFLKHSGESRQYYTFGIGEEFAEIEIYNLLGALMYESSVCERDIIDLRKLNYGLYIVKIKYKGNIITNSLLLD